MGRSEGAYDWAVVWARVGEGGTFTFRKAVPAPGHSGQVLVPAFLSTLPSVGPRVPSREPHSPSSGPGLGESPAPAHRNSPQGAEKSPPHPLEPGGTLLSLGREDKAFTMRTRCCTGTHLWAGLRTRLPGRPRVPQREASGQRLWQPWPGSQASFQVLCALFPPLASQPVFLYLLNTSP